MSPCNIPSSSVDASSFAYVVGIDIGSHNCDFCVIKPDKSQVIRPTTFANKHSGFEVLQSKLAQLHVPTERVLIGLEATSRYGENLYRFLEGQGYQLCLLHPRQTHQFARASGLARENGSAGRHHHCACTLERGGTSRLCADGSDCDKLGNWSACIRTSHTKLHSKPRF